jgi:hypothetical protein
VIQCQICQVTNDETAQFCRECGGRLQAPAPPVQASQSFAEPEAAQPEPPRRAKLRSPLFGGGGDDIDEEDAPSPSFKRVKSGQTGPNPSTSSQSGSGGQRRGLRSPLLGGDDDDMDEEDVAPKAKTGFGPFQHSNAKQKKTEFPHRHHDENEGHEAGNSQAANPNQGGAGGQKSTGARGLRSPLLGGGGGSDDGYDDDSAGRGKSRPTKPGKLRSPILGGGGGGDDYYEDEGFEEAQEQVNDPTALRSPLLAVRTPRSHAPQSSQAPQQQQAPQAPQAPSPVNQQVNSQAQSPLNMQVPEPKPSPFVQGPYSQASTSNAPNFALAGGPSLNPAAMPSVQAGSMPTAQAEAPYRGGPNYQPFPPDQSSQPSVVAPPAPTQQPAYSPPAAPAAPQNFNQNKSQNQNGAEAQAPQTFSPDQDPYSFGLGGNTFGSPAPSGVASPAPSPSASSSALASLSPGPSASPSPSSSYQAPLPPAPTASQTRPNQQALPPNPSASATALPEMPAPAAPKPSTARTTGTRFDAAEIDEPEAPKARGMRGSKLLADVTDDTIGPLDRRSRFADRRSAPRGERRTSPGASDQDAFDDHEPVQTLRGGSSYSAGAGGAAPNPMAPLLMASAVIALICKGYYISSFKPDVLLHNMPGTIDQGASILVLIAIILFALKSQSR